MPADNTKPLCLIMFACLDILKEKRNLFQVIKEQLEKNKDLVQFICYFFVI